MFDIAHLNTQNKYSIKYFYSGHPYRAYIRQGWSPFGALMADFIGVFFTCLAPGGGHLW